MFCLFSNFRRAAGRLKCRLGIWRPLRGTEENQPPPGGDFNWTTEETASYSSHRFGPVALQLESRLFLESAIEHLHDQQGIRYDSLGSSHNHGIAGDHLKEAKELIAHSDYSIAFKKMLCPLNTVFDRGEFEHFYMKQAVDSRQSFSSWAVLQYSSEA